MSDAEVQILPTLAEAQAAVAERIARRAALAVAERGRCLIAISGGSAPPGVFRLLCAEPLASRVPWEALSVVWADERYVPFADPESNYLQARQTLLNHVPIPPEQVYPVATYYDDPRQAAAIYEHLLRALLAQHGGQIDLALLGMGPDGHTASLFPGHPALAAPADQLVLVVEGSPKPPPRRISLSATALNLAREAIFLVAGADKAPMVAAALRGPHNPQHIPAQLIRPADGELRWVLDAAAARLVGRESPPADAADP